MKTFKITEENFSSYSKDEDYLSAEEIFIEYGQSRFNTEELILPSFAIFGHKFVQVIHISNISELFTKAISNCTELKKIIVEDDVLKKLPFDSISECSSICEVSLHEGLEECSTFSHTAIKEIIFPSTVKDISNCCNGCTGLKKVVLPDNLEEIGTSAFKNCYTLTYIRMGKHIKKICNSAFYCCYTLQEFSMSSEGMEYRNEDVFRKLKECTTIEQEAFAYCKGIQFQIYMPGLQELQYGGFMNTKITGFTIPETLKILNNPFIGDTELSSITLATGVSIDKFRNLFNPSILKDTGVPFSSALRALQGHKGIPMMDSHRENKSLLK